MLDHDLIDQLEAHFKDILEDVKEKLKDKVEDEITELGYKVDKLVLQIDEVCNAWIEKRMLDIETLTPTVDPIDPTAPQVDPEPPEKEPR